MWAGGWEAHRWWPLFTLCAGCEVSSVWLLDTYRSSRTSDGVLRRRTGTGCWQSGIMSYDLRCSFSYQSDVRFLALDWMDVEKREGRVPSERDVDDSPGQGVALLFGLN